jgi:hypothetical protein
MSINGIFGDSRPRLRGFQGATRFPVDPPVLRIHPFVLILEATD